MNARLEVACNTASKISRSCHPAARAAAISGSAIRRAVCEAGEGDIVLVAGKGHEAWQESKGQRVPFSDEAAVQAVLEEAA